MRNSAPRPSVLVAVLLAFALLSGSALAQALSDSARAQIAALLAEKETRTPVQRKVDSNLLYAVRISRGLPVADGVPRLETGLESAGPEGPVVDVIATVSEALLERITRLGGEVLDSHAGFRSIRARLPLGSVEELAADPAVLFIQPKQEAITWREFSLPPGPPTAAAAAVSSDIRRKLPPGFEERAERVRSQLAAALVRQQAADGGRTTLKTNTSEGDVTHRADLARANFGVNGGGVKVGVLSDGVDFLAAVQASGDLPAVTVLPGQAGGGDEGTAMLEIVHDLAPGAQLYFASAFGGIASFAQNILDLRAAG
ncbi:MAG TPA: neuroendocrine convertase 1, partial [Thermoanaerobaculia bacterium]|nr:neuroendocrine convertase 1 [Thermoanaerobaculia bacterium]